MPACRTFVFGSAAIAALALASSALAAVALLFFASGVSPAYAGAGPITITSPVGNPTFTSGQTVFVNWTTSGDVDICINVVDINANAAVGSPLCGANSAGTTFTLPPSLVCGTPYRFYALPQGQMNPPDYYAYGGDFTISCLNCCVYPLPSMKVWIPFDQPYGLTTKVPGTPSALTGTVTGPVLILGALPPPHSSGASLSILATNARVDFAANPALSFDVNDFSIDAWIRTKPHTGTNTLISTRIKLGATWADGSRGIRLFTYLGKVGLTMATGPTTNFISTYDISSPAGDIWHHVVVTVDRDSATGGRIYVDGIQRNVLDPVTNVASSTFNPNSLKDHTGSLGTSNPMLIGDENGTGKATFEIDEIEFFGRILNGSEVLALAKNPKCK